MVAIGRRRAYSSPSTVTFPDAVTANGGRKRITVPASPQSTVAGPRNGPGVTVQESDRRSMPTPSRDSAATIRSVSRLHSGAKMVDGPVAWAAKINARLVTDFEPGTRTVASTGPMRSASASRRSRKGSPVHFRPSAAVGATSSGPRRQRAATGGLGIRSAGADRLRD